MLSLSIMDRCRDPLCGSSKTEIYRDEVVCKICQVVIRPAGDSELLAIQRKTLDESSPPVRSKRKKSSLEFLIQYDKQKENRKSPAHHEGLKYIKQYPENINSLCKQAKKIFNKGVKAQSKQVRISNEISKMFMPSGKKNSSLFASYASLLYAHRILTDDWHDHLTSYTNFIQLNHKPHRNGHEMPLSSIRSDLSSAYSSLRKLVPPTRRQQYNHKTKSTELRQEIIRITTKYIDNNKISLYSRNLLEDVENNLTVESYQEKLETVIPNSGLEFIATEILWMILRLSEDKITRKKLSIILFDTDRRTSDRKNDVKKIISAINMDKELSKNN